MKRTVRAWAVIAPDGSLSGVDAIFGRKRNADEWRKAWGLRQDKAVRCTITYDDGKPGKGKP